MGYFISWQLRRDETETIVTTKLGLGGLDINILEMEADLVINFDMPKDITDFQLRGR